MKTFKLSGLIVLLLAIVIIIPACQEDFPEPAVQTDGIVKNSQNIRMEAHKYLFGSPGIPQVVIPEGPRKLEIPETVEIQNVPNGRQPIKIYAITPTGNYPDDIESIQSALNASGELGENCKIILRSLGSDGLPKSFNFGESSGFNNEETSNRLIIWGETDGHSGQVEIVGESIDGHQATVSGGVMYDPFGDSIRFESIGIQIFDRTSVSISNINFTNNAAIMVARDIVTLTEYIPPGELTIKNCNFQSMIGSALLVDGSVGRTLISNNHFEDFGWEVGFFHEHSDLQFIGNTMVNEGSGYTLTLWLVSGNLNIVDNNINTKAGDFIFEFATGIFYCAENSTQLNISGNTILSDDSGIAINDASGADQTNPVTITNNDIEIFETMPWATGLVITSFNGANFSNICASNNVIKGSGNWAIEISSGSTFYPEFGFPSGSFSNISLFENDLSNFIPICSAFPIETLGITSCPKIYLDPTTSDMNFCGETDDIVDQGRNNEINTLNCQSGC